MNTTLERLERSIDGWFRSVKGMSEEKAHTAPVASNAPEGLQDNQCTAFKSPATTQRPSVSTVDIFSTPAAMIDQSECGLMANLIRMEYSRKRKMISPIQSSPIDSSFENPMSQQEEKIAENVITTVSSWVGEYMSSMHSTLNTQFEQALSELRSEMRQDIASDDRSRWDPSDKDVLMVHREDINSLQTENEDLRDHCRVLEGRITRAEKEISDLNEEILQLTARSMRDNLVFYNVPEPVNENCAATLWNFLTDEMKISQQHMNRILLDRVHRMGKKGGSFPRPLVAKFNSSESKEVIMAHTKNLDRNKKFGINDQLPRELEERKKRLLPQFKEAKSKQLEPKWSVDKLVVKGQIT